MKTNMAIKADFLIELPALPNFMRTEDGKTLIKHAEARRRNPGGPQ